MPPGEENNKWAEVVEDGTIVLYQFLKENKPSPVPAATMPRNIASDPKIKLSPAIKRFSKYLYATKFEVGTIKIAKTDVLGTRKGKKEQIRVLFADDEVVLKQFDAAEKISFEFLWQLIRRYNERDVQRKLEHNVNP